MKVISRAQWGARPAKHSHPQTVGPGSIVFIHHTTDKTPSRFLSRAKEAALLRATQRFHQDVRGWDDIGYSYIVFPSGRVYEGRGQNQIPASQQNANTGHLSICFYGNFDNSKTTWAARKSAALLARQLPGKYLAGHQDAADLSPLNRTACPGKNLYSQLDRLAELAHRTRLHHSGVAAHR